MGGVGSLLGRMADTEAAIIILLDAGLRPIHLNAAARRTFPAGPLDYLDDISTRDLLLRARRTSSTVPGRLPAPRGSGTVRAEAAWLREGETLVGLLRLHEHREASAFAEINRRLAERGAALRRRSQQLAEARLFLEATHDGVLVVEAPGRIVQINPAFQQMYPDIRVHGMLLDLIDFGPLTKAVRDGFSGQIANLDGLKGEVRPHSGAACSGPPAEVSFGVGQPPGADQVVVVVFRDLSERRDRDEAVARAGLLEMARQRAEEREQVKSSFLSLMSHEMRTPLNGLIASSELLLEDVTLTARQRNLVEIIHGSAETALTQVNHLLDSARSEVRQETDHIQAFDPGRIALDMTMQFQPLADKRGNKLLLELPDGEIPRVRGDSRKYQRILQNLVGNALKFTPGGRVIIRLLSSAVVDPTGDFVLLRTEIQDTGVGIAPDRIEKIFEPFEKGEDGSDGAIRGTGLGLSVVRETVEGLDGTLEVYSAPGSGSLFAFTLRFVRARDVTEDRSGSETEVGVNVQGAAKALTNARMTVLVADDNEVNRAILREILSAAGVDVIEVGNGLDAARTAQDHAVDLVLMDVSMPILDGLAASRLMQEYPTSRDVPVIALTAFSDPEIEAQCRAAGMIQVVTKPVRPVQVRGLLDDALKKTEARRAMPSERVSIPRVDPAGASDLVDLVSNAELLDMHRRTLQDVAALGGNLESVKAGANTRDTLIEQATHLLASVSTLGLRSLVPVIHAANKALQDGSNAQASQLGGLLRTLAEDDLLLP